MASLTIGNLAERGGVNLETSRYCEREVSALRRLRFLKRINELSFTPGGIKELPGLRNDPDQPCSDVILRIEAKSCELERKIAHWRTMRRALIRLTCSREGDCHVGECPIHENLDAEAA